MSSDLPDRDGLSPDEVAQNRSLDTVRARLVADAQSWATQLSELSSLCARAERAGPQTRRTLALEMAGSWQVSQLTAEKWLMDADRIVEALPRTLSMLAAGALLRHQATVLLHGTKHCAAEVARAVEAEVLPDGAGLCTSDLRRKVDRVRLRIERELVDAADAERQEAEKVSSRRTFARATGDGMGMAGAILTPEQLASWAAGMDVLEKRERIADRAAGIERTADQRRADLFAALPALVLSGMAADDRWRRDSALPTGGRRGARRPNETEPLFTDDEGPCPPPWTFSPDQVAAQIVLNVHVPMSTVLDLTHAPGTLERYGPVSAERVRLLRPTGLRRIVVDATSGRPVAVEDRVTPVDGADAAAVRDRLIAMLRPIVIADREEPQHDPSAQLARLVDLRDVHCGGPGCSSTRCDRDHLEPYPHGPTSAANLGLASPRCHSAKHHGWSLIRHPDGSVTWLSPLRRRYDRPGPWDPPPYLDPDSVELPPLRSRPAAPPPAGEDDDRPLLDQLTESQAEAEPEPPPPTAHGWSDDPPF